MKKITHKEIAIVLGVTPSAITQRVNAPHGFYVWEAKKLSKHFGVPLEAWADIKSYLQEKSNTQKKEVRDV